MCLLLCRWMQYGKTLKLKKRKIAFENVYRTYIFLVLVYRGSDHRMAHSPSKLWLRTPCSACGSLGNRWTQAGLSGQVMRSAQPEPSLPTPTPSGLLATSHHRLLWLWERRTGRQLGNSVRELWRQQSASKLTSEKQSWDGQSSQHIKCWKCLKCKDPGRLEIKPNKQKLDDSDSE